MILLTQVSEPTLGYYVISCLIGIIISGLLVRGILKKKEKGENLIDTDAIHEIFIKLAKDLIDEIINLNGASDFSEFSDIMQKKLVTLMSDVLHENLGEGVFSKVVTQSTIEDLINYAYENSDLEKLIEEKYDALVDAISKDAEKYEDEVAKENESFEEGTAEVPEYKELEEPVEPEVKEEPPITEEATLGSPIE